MLMLSREQMRNVLDVPYHLWWVPEICQEGDHEMRILQSSIEL